jgi:hypothetical protein
VAIDRGQGERGAPDSRYILDLMVELGDQYKQQDLDIDEMRSVREMKVPAMQEADSRYIMVHVDPRDPDITEEAFQQTAILTLERPKLSIVGGEGDTAQTIASKLEHWTEETFWQCGTREPGQDTMVQVTDACLNDGGGWTKLLWPRTRGRPVTPCRARRLALVVMPGRTTTSSPKTPRSARDPPFVWDYVDRGRLPAAFWRQARRGVG